MVNVRKTKGKSREGIGAQLTAITTEIGVQNHVNRVKAKLCEIDDFKTRELIMRSHHLV